MRRSEAIHTNSYQSTMYRNIPSSKRKAEGLCSGRQDKGDNREYVIGDSIQALTCVNCIAEAWIGLDEALARMTAPNRKKVETLRERWRTERIAAALVKAVEGTE